MVDFGVERHTLVIGKITQVFHHSSAAVTQVPIARAHLSRVRAQLLRRFSGSTCPIQGEFRDSPPTQLRGRQGASFAWMGQIDSLNLLKSCALTLDKCALVVVPCVTAAEE